MITQFFPKKKIKNSKILAIFLTCGADSRLAKLQIHEVKC